VYSSILVKIIYKVFPKINANSIAYQMQKINIFVEKICLNNWKNAYGAAGAFLL